MAIDFTKPADPKHLIFESLEFNMRHKWIRMVMLDEDGEALQFTTKEAQWGAALSLLFDDLTDAAELKDRIETYLVANEIVGGTKVED